MAVDTWTEEKLATLKRLWDAGLSGTQISAEIGVSRGAVLGKVWRLKLENPGGKPTTNATRVYVRQPLEITKANARERNKRYRLKNAAQRGTDPQAGLRCRLLSQGAAPTSAIYRKFLPRAPRDMTRADLRAMLTQAVQNTAAMVVS